MIHTAGANLSDKGTAAMFKTIHLGGGLRCSIDPAAQRLDVWPFANNSGIQISLSDMSQFVSILQARGLEVIGVEEGMVLPQRRFTALWQVSPYIVGEIDVTKMPVSFWAGIKTASYGAKCKELEELSSSIAFSLTAMERHLLSLSNEYHRELITALERGAKPKDRFVSVETYDLWLSIHAFLLAAGSARDYLAQALAGFVFHNEINRTSKKKPDSMARLLDHGRKYGYLDKHAVGRTLVNINDETDSDAWMANMSEFRNVITHRAPITQYRNTSRLELAHTGVFGTHDVLQIVLPLPKRPRSSGDLTLADALVLMRYYNERLARLSFEVGKLMPYPPRTVTLTDNEIIDIQPL